LDDQVREADLVAVRVPEREKSNGNSASRRSTKARKIRTISAWQVLGGLFAVGIAESGGIAGSDVKGQGCHGWFLSPGLIAGTAGRGSSSRVSLSKASVQARARFNHHATTRLSCS
jgi:hypothetical protein